MFTTRPITDIPLLIRSMDGAKFPEQDALVKAVTANDVAAVRALYGQLKAFPVRSDKLLITVAIGEGYDDLFPPGLRTLFSELRELGLGADILVGVNNGARIPLTQEFLASSKVLTETFFTHGRFYKNRPAQMGKENELFAVLDNEVCANQIRAIVIEQKGREAAGKIRILGDIYKFVTSSIEAGYVLPSLTLAIDAETRLGGVGANALSDLIYMREKLGHDFLGTSWRFSAFKKDPATGYSEPNLDAPISNLHEMLQRAHGQDGFNFCPGGGTLGESRAWLACNATVAWSYPGSKMEDLHASILANLSGFSQSVARAIFSINRCDEVPPCDVVSKRKAMRQIGRWFMGAKALELQYGKAALKTTFNTKVLANYKDGWQFNYSESSAQLKPDILTGNAIWAP